jgi:hypothetical protein
MHEMDIARWGLGVKYPTKLSAIAGHFMFDDDQETPKTLTSTFEFNDGGKKKMLALEVRHWMTNLEEGIHEFDKSAPSNCIGNLFYGSKGFMGIDGYDRYKTWMGKEQELGPAMKEGGDHFANFINAVRSRKREGRRCGSEQNVQARLSGAFRGSEVRLTASIASQRPAPQRETCATRDVRHAANRLR